MKPFRVCTLLSTILALSSLAAFGQQPASSVELLATFDYPRPGTAFTAAWGINNNGVVAGTFTWKQHEHGYVRNASGAFGPPITVSPTARTMVQAINIDGLVAGYSIDTDGEHGFFYQDGIVTHYDVPNSTATLIFGLNDAGDFTGLYTTSGVTLPYANIEGSIINPAPPNAEFTWANGINNHDEIAGYYEDSSDPGHTHGFFRARSGNTVAPIDYPRTSDTQFLGLNDQGTLVGVWYDEHDLSHGLVLRNLTEFISFDVPGARQTILTGINNSNIISGFYFVGNTGSGFIAQLVNNP
jgi:hypothetical protein